jgi:hypothetical protein
MAASELTVQPQVAQAHDAAGMMNNSAAITARSNESIMKISEAP